MNDASSLLEPTGNKWAQLHRETTEPEYPHTSHAPWVFILALAVALVGLACFGYFALRKTNIQVTQLFGNQGTLSTLGHRVDTVESKLGDVTGRWESVTQRLTMVETTINRNIQQTRKYAQVLTEQLHQQMTAEIQSRTSVLDARLRQVESDEAAQHSQLARVEGALQQQIASTREETGRDFSGVQQSVDDNARKLNALSQQLDRERIAFEVKKGQTTELVPGVTLQVSGTNDRYQRFRGSLWLLQDRRTLWLRDESVNQPVRFYHKEGGQPDELIVTDVTQHSVIGYLLVPKFQ